MLYIVCPDKRQLNRSFAAFCSILIYNHQTRNANNNRKVSVLLSGPLARDCGKSNHSNQTYSLQFGATVDDI